MRAGIDITQSSFWKRLPFKGFIVTALALNVLTVAAFVILRGNLPPVVPLLYGHPSGESQLVPTLWLLSAPTVSFFLIVINSLISNYISDIFAKKLLVTATLLLSILTTITVFKIVFLVGFF